MDSPSRTSCDGVPIAVGYAFMPKKLSTMAKVLDLVCGPNGWPVGVQRSEQITLEPVDFEDAGGKVCMHGLCTVSQ
jgi:hypothetical protein